MIRVLEVIRQGEIGGGESHVIDLVTNLDTSEVTPVVLAMSDGPMIRRLGAEGIRCIVIPSAHAFDPSIVRNITQVVRDERIDIIHAHGSRAASNMLLVAKWMGKPLIYTVHGWSFHTGQNPLIHRLRALGEKLICRCADRVICVSESNAQTGRDTFRLRHATVIENGVNTLRFSPTAVESDLRESLRIAPDAIVVSFIARMTMQKAPLLYLEGLRLAHEANQRITGLMVGSGDMDAQVAAYIEQEGMESYVVRQPLRTDVPELLATTDIYCMPSHWEGLSIALLEAMAMQRPVVVTPTDGTREVIRDAENGTIVPFNDALALSEALLDLADGEQARADMGRQARATVLARFNAKHVSDEVTEIYKKLRDERIQLRGEN